MLQRRLGGGEYTPDVDVDHAIHLFQRRLLERFRYGRAGIVHKHIKPAEGCHGFVDRSFDSFSVGGVRLDRNSLSAVAFNLLDHAGSGAGVLRVGDCDAGSVVGETFRDRCADSREPPVMSATNVVQLWHVISFLVSVTTLDLLTGGLMS